jgi:hypothetical protein
MSWQSERGTFTVDPGEKSGSIDMVLMSGPSDPNPETVKGKWRCG